MSRRCCSTIAKDELRQSSTQMNSPRRCCFCAGGSHAELTQICTRTRIDRRCSTSSSGYASC
eukprot:scaffold521787_cov36-Prasinocladus_malaysianus.AAC.1